MKKSVVYGFIFILLLIVLYSVWETIFLEEQGISYYHQLAKKGQYDELNNIISSKISYKVKIKVARGVSKSGSLEDFEILDKLAREDTIPLKLAVLQCAKAHIPKIEAYKLLLTLLRDDDKVITTSTIIVLRESFTENYNYNPEQTLEKNEVAVNSWSQLLSTKIERLESAGTGL